MRTVSPIENSYFRLITFVSELVPATDRRQNSSFSSLSSWRFEGLPVANVLVIDENVDVQSDLTLLVRKPGQEAAMITTIMARCLRALATDEDR